MDPNSQHYAAIICEFRVYKPTIMLFGLQNTPALFQRHMNYILRKLVATRKVFIYIDDILIATDNLEEHRELTHGVLQALNYHMNPSQEWSVGWSRLYCRREV